LTGFAGGLEVKRYLLDPEANGLRGAHPVPSMAKELPGLALERLPRHLVADRSQTKQSERRSQNTALLIRAL
jgi:hypothetical protein